MNKLFENGTELPSYITRVRRRIFAEKRIMEEMLKILSHPRWQVKEPDSMAGVVCELRVKLAISALCVADTHHDGI